MNNIQVLIVEDDLRIAEINKRFTNMVKGYEVCGIATDLEQAKDMVSILKPDLILLDVYFPQGSGLDLLRYIRTNQLSSDVIMITAAKEIDAVKEALRGGAIDYIIKPIVFERFNKTLEQYKQYRSKITEITVVDQDQVDNLYEAVRTQPFLTVKVPKGIDPLTLDKIKSKIGQQKEHGLTAEELGRKIGMSRTTARRYLEFLVSQGDLRAELSYGTVGRPERRYFYANLS